MPRETLLTAEYGGHNAAELKLEGYCHWKETKPKQCSVILKGFHYSNIEYVGTIIIFAINFALKQSKSFKLEIEMLLSLLWLAARSDC